MSEIVKKQIAEFLARYRHLSLATVAPDGGPQVRTLAYVSEGPTVTMATLGSTQKVANIRKNRRVSFTVADDQLDWDVMQSVQAEGKAEILRKKDDIERARTLLEQKFPRFREFADHPETVYIRVRPTVAYFLDHTKGSGHREKVKY